MKATTPPQEEVSMLLLAWSGSDGHAPLKTNYALAARYLITVVLSFDRRQQTLMNQVALSRAWP